MLAYLADEREAEGAAVFEVLVREPQEDHLGDAQNLGGGELFLLPYVGEPRRADRTIARSLVAIGAYYENDALALSRPLRYRSARAALGVVRVRRYHQYRFAVVWHRVCRSSPDVVSCLWRDANRPA